MLFHECFCCNDGEKIESVNCKSRTADNFIYVQSFVPLLLPCVAQIMIPIFQAVTLFNQSPFERRNNLIFEVTIPPLGAFM